MNDNAPVSVTNFVSATPPSNSMENLSKFLLLLNERYPIDREITKNFNGNHSIVFDTTGLSVGQPCLVVTVWVFKQLDWRCYAVGLDAEDLLLTPEGLLKEVVRVLDVATAKLIAPTSSRKVVAKSPGAPA
jgi:hypothetical protein